MNEEEGLDGAALATGTSENIHASHGFLRGVRNTQVSPEGMILALVLFTLLCISPVNVRASPRLSHYMEQGMLSTFPQCNFPLEFPDTKSKSYAIIG